MKVAIYSGLIFLVIIGLFFVFNNYIYNEKQAEYIVGSDEEVSGLVVAVDQDQIAFDGPYQITLQLGDGGIESYQTIEVPSMGITACPSFEQIRIISDIVEGSRITVFGERVENGSIVPCADALHKISIDSVPAREVREAVDATDSIRAVLLEEVSRLYPEAFSLAITDIREIQWGDSCLGLSLQEVACVPEVIPGYVIAVYVDDEVKEFRTTLDGSLILEAK